MPNNSTPSRLRKGLRPEWAGPFDYRNVAAKGELGTALVDTATRLPRCARNDIRGQSKGLAGVDRVLRLSAATWVVGWRVCGSMATGSCGLGGVSGRPSTGSGRTCLGGGVSGRPSTGSGRTCLGGGVSGRPSTGSGRTCLGGWAPFDWLDERAWAGWRTCLGGLRGADGLELAQGLQVGQGG